MEVDWKLHLAVCCTLTCPFKITMSLISHYATHPRTVILFPLFRELFHVMSHKIHFLLHIKYHYTLFTSFIAFLATVTLGLYLNTLSFLYWFWCVKILPEFWVLGKLTFIYATSNVIKPKATNCNQNNYKQHNVMEKQISHLILSQMRLTSAYHIDYVILCFITFLTLYNFI